MRSQKPLGKIAFIVDERLSREKNAILTRSINALRHLADIELFTGSIEEERLIEKLEGDRFQLVMAPWYRYLAWSRIEAMYGLTRTSGPTFAGYFCDGIQPYEMGDQADHLRTILLDFTHLSTQEIVTLIKSLAVDTKRSGIRPFFDPNTPIHVENWFSSQGLGHRMEVVMSLPGIAGTDWLKRASAIRICLSALWGLVYEEGPGKGEFTQVITGRSPKASFQMGVDTNYLVFRLCYSMPTWSPKDALSAFWPNLRRPTGSAQLLLKFCDFVRVHTISEAADVEVVVGFMNSAPAENAPEQIHTLWVEPISANLVQEIPFEAPGPQAKHLRALPQVSLLEQKTGPTAEEKQNERAKERFIFEAAGQIRQLKARLAERDEMIRELRSGGVGTAPPMPPPDMEGLLDAFQERYIEVKFEIKELESQIAELEERGGSPQEVEGIRQRIVTLTNRERQWLKKIGSTLELYRNPKRKAEG